MTTNRRPQRQFVREICIWRDSQTISVEPDVPDLLADLCTVNQRVVGQESGYGIAGQSESLLIPAIGRANAGLELAVRAWAARRGIGVRVQPLGFRPRPLPQPIPCASNGTTFGDLHVPRFVQQHERGIIRYWPGVSLCSLIAQIILTFPNATFAIMRATRDRARQLAQQLRRLGIRVTLATATKCPDKPGRVVVSTFNGMAHPQIELEKRHVVFLPNAVEAVAERAQLPLLTADSRFRPFAFMPLDGRLSPREEDWLMAVFGFEELDVPRHWYGHVQVEVVLHAVHGPRITGRTAITIKRRGIWLHHARNRRTAQLAAALASGGEQLARQFPEIADLPDHQPRRVAVAVENVEQAIALSDFLPDWPLLLARDVITTGLTPQQLAALQRSWSGGSVGGRFIATITALAEAMPTLDAVVWAGGGPHAPALPPGALLSPATESRRLLLVDCQDHHHPLLCRWSRRRQREYVLSGWFPAGVDPVRGRAELFLAKRPKVRS